MNIQKFIAEFKKTFIYDMLCETLVDEQLFEHAIVGNQVIWMKEQTRQMWFMWQAAPKVAVPEGFILMPKEPEKDTLIAIASVCIGDEFANLDEAKELYKAVIEAQELSHD